jgi:hypothetical protein
VHDDAAKALRLLGVSEPAITLLGDLFNWTQPQDWHAGAITMQDSGNNKRHGRRNSADKLILGATFGYDLSPLAIHYTDYQTVVKAHKADCALRKEARRRPRSTVARFSRSSKVPLIRRSTTALTDVAQRFELLRADALAVFARKSAERASSSRRL